MEPGIYLGDAYELIKKVESKSVDLVITDPPYEYENLDGGGIGDQRQFFKEIEEANIKDGFDMSLIDELMRVLKKPNLYIWVSKKQFKKVLDYVVDKYRCSFDLIVWAKINPPPLCKCQYLHDCEYCLYFHDGIKLNTNFDTAKTFYYLPTNKEDKQKFLHPTIKPEAIIKNFVLNSSERGGDSFRPVFRIGHYGEMQLRCRASMHRL